VQLLIVLVLRGEMPIEIDRDVLCVTRSLSKPDTLSDMTPKQSNEESVN